MSRLAASKQHCFKCPRRWWHRKSRHSQHGNSHSESSIATNECLNLGGIRESGDLYGSQMASYHSSAGPIQDEKSGPLRLEEARDWSWTEESSTTAKGGLTLLRCFGDKGDVEDITEGSWAP